MLQFNKRERAFVYFCPNAPMAIALIAAFLMFLHGVDSNDDTFDTMRSSLMAKCTPVSSALCTDGRLRLTSCMNADRQAIYADEEIGVFPITLTYLLDSTYQGDNGRTFDYRGCVSGWDPFGPRLNKQYEDKDVYITYTNCVVIGPDDCEECRLGYNKNPANVTNGNRFRYCKKQSKPLISHQKNLEIVKKGIEQCGMGMFRQGLQAKCTGVCPANCVRCDSSESCNVCAPGTIAARGSTICSQRKRCPGHHYWDRTRCAHCSTITEGCVDCSPIGVCNRCERHLFLIHTHNSIMCSPACPRMYFYDHQASRCNKCAFACESCDSFQQCSECSDTSFSFLKPDGYYLCYMKCPFGTYQTATAPFRCIECDKSCHGCYGPSAFECDYCKSYGILTRTSLLAKCSSYFEHIWIDFDPHPGDYLDPVKRKSFILMAQYETSSSTPLPFDPDYGYFYDSEIPIFSRTFRSFKEAEMKLNLSKKNVPLRRKFYPACQSSERCTTNCEMQAPYNPCVNCANGFYREFDRSCVASCSKGLLPNHINRTCELGFLGDLCDKYEWKNMNEIMRQYSDFAPDSFNISHSCLVKPASMNCIHEYQFQSGSHCLMCHSECKECTGLSSEYCVRCRRYRDEHGHCVRECPPGTIPIRVNIYFVCQPPLGVSNSADKLPDISFSRGKFSALWIPFIAIAVLVLQLVAANLFLWKVMPPRDRRAHILHFKYEQEIGEEATLIANAKSAKHRNTNEGKTMPILAEFAAAALETGKNLERDVTSFRNTAALQVQMTQRSGRDAGTIRSRTKSDQERRTSRHSEKKHTTTLDSRKAKRSKSSLEREAEDA